MKGQGIGVSRGWGDTSGRAVEVGEAEDISTSPAKTRRVAAPDP
jgi:hypothetical protein